MSDNGTTLNDSEGEKKDGGLGDEGTIPDSETGLAVGVTGDSHFNPEEDAPAEDES
ncbi:hypothetical protein MT349_13100 [Rathayibacter caricis]|uniref:hypothetical protein n=1 Tax=Rathayibacter caricis TaxID=110936 RepID=UPI001FB2FFE0|nr:hypothetical protein [Rathayibacter caricis]MCJ1696714.1 hypothetical protein [Rathayibacter caricis]